MLLEGVVPIRQPENEGLKQICLPLLYACLGCALLEGYQGVCLRCFLNSFVLPIDAFWVHGECAASRSVEQPRSGSAIGDSLCNLHPIAVHHVVVGYRTRGLGLRWGVRMGCTVSLPVKLRWEAQVE